MRATGRVTAVLAVLLAMLAGAQQVASNTQAGSSPSPLSAQAPGSKKVTQLTFAFNSKDPLVPPLAHFYIGKELGYFAEEGIDVQYVGSEGGGQTIQLLSAGKVDIALGLQDALLKALANGEKPPIQMIFSYTKGLIYHIGVKPDSPIRTAADLKGKRIGVLSFSHPGYDYARQVVKEVGLDPDKDIQWVVVGQGNPAGRALHSGQVDALAHWDFHYVDLAALGYPTRLLPQPPAIEKIRAGHVAAVNTEKTKDAAYRRAIVGFLRATAKSLIFQQENPEAAVRIMWRLYPQIKPTVDEDKELKRIVDQFEIRAKILRIQPGRLGYFEPGAWESYVAYLGLAGKVDPKAWYTNEYLKDVNSFDVTAIRKAAREYKL